LTPIAVKDQANKHVKASLTLDHEFLRDGLLRHGGKRELTDELLAAYGAENEPDERTLCDHVLNCDLST
jgi:hypothetical protein